MTTIATDGKSMAGDGMAKDHCETIVSMSQQKVYRLPDGRIVGGSGDSFDLESWRAWLSRDKAGECPIASDQFAGLILNLDGSVLWVDHKGRELEIQSPCSVGSGQDYAYGAMGAGASPERAVEIACLRDLYSGGVITSLELVPLVAAVEAA